MGIRIVRRKNGQARIDKIQKGLKGPKRVKVGFPAGETSSAILDRAVWNHFGTSRGIPERPFMLEFAQNSKSALKGVHRKLAKAVLSGRITMRQAVEQLGLWGAARVTKAIIDLNSPPNHPSTIAQKGSSNPLVDTGEMAQASTHKVIE